MTRSKTKPPGQKLNSDALQIIDVRHSCKGKEVLA